MPTRTWYRMAALQQNEVCNGADKVMRVPARPGHRHYDNESFSAFDRGAIHFCGAGYPII